MQKLNQCILHLLIEVKKKKTLRGKAPSLWAKVPTALPEAWRRDTGLCLPPPLTSPPPNPQPSHTQERFEGRKATWGQLDTITMVIIYDQGSFGWDLFLNRWRLIL